MTDAERRALEIRLARSALTDLRRMIAAGSGLSALLLAGWAQARLVDAGHTGWTCQAVVSAALRLVRRS